ncbi:MAG: hypothetical protein Q9181_006774 [Wetmoreana brouardii]
MTSKSKRLPPDPLILCAAKSRTYISLTTTSASMDARLLRPVIASAYQQILHTLAPPSKDRIISFDDGWIFTNTIGAFDLKIRSAGSQSVPLWVYGLLGHAAKIHLTYGQLRDALLTLYDHMSRAGWSEATFDIYDAGQQSVLEFFNSLYIFEQISLAHSRYLTVDHKIAAALTPEEPAEEPTRYVFRHAS